MSSLLTAGPGLVNLLPVKLTGFRIAKPCLRWADVGVGVIIQTSLHLTESATSLRSESPHSYLATTNWEI